MFNAPFLNQLRIPGAGGGLIQFLNKELINKSNDYLNDGPRGKSPQLSASEGNGEVASRFTIISRFEQQS